MDSVINLKEIDWNKMSPEEFSALEKELQSKKLLKRKKAPEKKKDYVIVKINGKMYNIDNNTYIRLKTMTSNKCKEKLINKIISENNPVQNW